MHDPILPTRSRARIASDNRAELDAWIDARVAALVAAGVPLADARHRARTEFGDVDAALGYADRQDVAADRRVRVALWLEELASDLRIAARTLARAPTVTGVVLLTFALGIGAATAVFSVVHALMLRALPYGNERTLVYLPAADSGVIRRRVARLGDRRVWRECLRHPCTRARVRRSHRARCIAPWRGVARDA